MNSSQARMPTGGVLDRHVQHEVLAAEREQDQQQVAGEHVARRVAGPA